MHNTRENWLLEIGLQQHSRANIVRIMDEPVSRLHNTQYSAKLW